LTRIKPIFVGEQVEINFESDEKTFKQIYPLIIKLLQKIGKQVNNNLLYTISDKVFLNGKSIPELSLFITQILSWTTLLYQHWIKIIPSGKKKKTPEPITTEFKNFTRELMTELKNNFTELTSLLVPTNMDSSSHLFDVTTICINFLKNEVIVLFRID